jgi:two-component system, NarL family, sensor histidine kinase DesK
VQERPARRSPVSPVVGVTLVVLIAVLMVTGAEGMLALVLPAVIVALAVSVAAWAIWRTRTDRTAYEARLTAWAASEAVLAERLRLAGDLHDIVSHGLGLITVRAAAARLSGDPAEARAALADVENAGREATTELRRMLTVLRDAGADPRQPVEDLSLLPELVTGAPGIRPRLHLEELGTVSAGVQVAICRTVREALHNVARHVGPSDVKVHVYRDGDTVITTVHNGAPDGPWPSAPGAGHGLTVLRERAERLGGTLHAGPVEQGFRVVSRIPDALPAGP